MLVPPPPSSVNILFSAVAGEHRPEVVDVGRELRLDALGDQLGHRLHAGCGVARLVVEVGVVERRAAELGDVLGGEVEAAAHRLAVERPGARSAPARRRARSSCPCRRWPPRRRAARRGRRRVAAAAAAGRRRAAAVVPRRRAGGRRCAVGAAAVVVVVTAAGGEEGGRADRPGRAEQHPAAGDPPLVHDLLRHVLVIHRSGSPCSLAITPLVARSRRATSDGAAPVALSRRHVARRP